MALALFDKTDILKANFQSTEYLKIASTIIISVINNDDDDDQLYRAEVCPDFQYHHHDHCLGG